MPVCSNRRLRRTEHLRRRADFERVFAARRSSGDDILVVYVADNGLAWSRLGMSVGRGVGDAVRRNYLRRRIREAFRNRKDDIPSGMDIVCVAKPAADRRRNEIEPSLLALIGRAQKRPAPRSRSAQYSRRKAQQG